ncbi:hypothetical protein Slin_6162 [Spirosoma linguale DSM 74]|uniref:Uncharacterized protein n=1 Tax=Spirosoma linguale (strain ATCC 33905 / DSM 74 / LMG 10896 / Claus 1) TaxID=504472 RepID=D2QTJ0_SPILD|nr:hypothetical protein Slin_6162 [Spirosoma linguale DSM 74]
MGWELVFLFTPLTIVSVLRNCHITNIVLFIREFGVLVVSCSDMHRAEVEVY